MQAPSNIVKPTDVVRDLGVLLDSELTMKWHISKMVSTCFYHLRRSDATWTLIPWSSWRPLSSSVDYTTVTLFYTGYHRPFATSAERRCAGHTWSVTAWSCPRLALKELHWLPVAHRIQYKVALLMFMVHDYRCPVYVSESVHPVSSNPVRQRLRSASSLDYIVPRTKTKFGDQAYSVAGPTVWNSLPESVRLAETLSSSKRKLKTYLFTISF